jgi:radical SAM superfamily enzyme YgiQ (UPF0313 family)
MDKQFTNEDMYFSIDELLKNNINCTLMFIVGYPTETHEDYEENIKFLKYYADRNSSVIDPDGPNGSVADINLGQTLGILPDSPLHDMPVHNKDMMFWKSTVVEDLTFDVRVKRRKELSVIANDLGYNVRWDEKQLHFLEKKLESYYKDIA